MISWLRKVKYKLSTDGMNGLFTSIARRFRRIISKQIFKFKAAFFILKLNRNFPENSFKLTNIDEFSPIQFPTQEILNNIKANKYLILSEDFMDFGKLPYPGILIWNKDLINNIEWPMEKWGVDIPIHTNNGDIKRPWELGRLHQLVQLGLCYRTVKGEVEKAEVFNLASKIFKNFIDSNIGFRGPQWMCPMDVGIRISNICLAADLFGKPFLQEHGKDLTKEIKRHEFFIENNLENRNGFVISNHYLGNLVGLIFCSCHLKPDIKLIRKIKKIYNELLNGLDQQFLNDGGNFESSTYYHRLSGEMILFGLALCQDYLFEQSLSIVLSENQKAKLRKILYFSESITDQEGYVLQIGDNDSGHLFIFDPIEFKKDDLNHNRFISSLRIFLEEQNTRNLFSKVIKGFANKEVKFPHNILESKDKIHGDESLFFKTINELPKKNNYQRYEFKIENSIANQRNLALFPDFGLFIYKTEKFFFSVRSGVSKCDVIGGHRHIDQLSMALKSKSFSLPRDPGSFVYTSDTKTRNKLRSAPVHQIPFAEGDGMFSNEGIFELKNFKGECIFFGNNGFLGYYDGQLDRYYRLIHFTADCIIIYDWSKSGLQIPRLGFNEEVFSPRYGKLVQ